MIVGKRALPALGLAAEGGPLAAQVDAVVEPDDIAIAFGAEEADGAETVAAAGRGARQRGCLTIAFADGGAEWEFAPEADDPFVRQELVETLYHVLWELVHVFFDHRGLLAGRERSAGPRRRRLELPLPVPRRVRDRPRRGDRGRPPLGADEGRPRSATLREQTLGENGEALARAAATCASASTPAASCSPAATAVRRPTRWTWLPIS